MPESIRLKQARGQHIEKVEYDTWLKRLGSKGWLTGKWRKDKGGHGWTPEQFLAFQEEVGRAGAPPVIAFGPTMAGPVIYTFGTETQQQQHLPGIMRNNVWWCQSYSEPGAGSDLAGLSVGNIDVAKFEQYLGRIRRMLTETQEGGMPLSEDPLFKRRMAELEVGFATVKALMADQLAAARQDGAPSLMGVAALKLSGTELQQAILQTGLDLLGRHGMVYQSEALHAGWNGQMIGPEDSADVMYEHLFRRAATIYGGSSEVQKNIIAKGALGL